MASRIVTLLKVTGIKDGSALLTGGLALDSGLPAAIREEMVKRRGQRRRGVAARFDLRRRPRRGVVGRLPALTVESTRSARCGEARRARRRRGGYCPVATLRPAETSSWLEAGLRRARPAETR
jgi:hypothetical protein